MPDAPAPTAADPLLPAVARGEAGAVEACIGRYAGAVWWLADRYLPTRVDAEDGVQDVFLDLWRSAGRFDPAAGTEKTFVLTVARRRLIDRRRRLAARPDFRCPVPPDRRDPAAGPPAAAECADESARARGELRNLPPDQRRVIELAVDGGLSQTEIAASTGLPLGTVKSHARRGLRRLRDRLTARPAPAAKPAPSPTHTPAVPLAPTGEDR